MKITTLVEDHQLENGLMAEHGLSMLIEDNYKKILFDTGTTDLFWQNAIKLGIDLNEVTDVVISHAHYDHGGGVNKMLEINNHFTLHVSKLFFEPKFKKIEKGFETHGIKFSKDDVTPRKINFIEKNLTKICDNIYILANFKREKEYDKVNAKYYIERNGIKIVDNFDDEIAIVLIREDGAYLLVGCSHKGINSIVSTVEKRLDTKLIGIIGGIHLMNAEDTKIKKTFEDLKKSNLQFIALSHCTGERAIKYAKNEYKDKFILNATGTKLF